MSKVHTIARIYSILRDAITKDAMMMMNSTTQPTHTHPLAQEIATAQLLAP